MNKCISFLRIRSLVCYDLRINHKKYVMDFLAMYVMFLLVYFFTMLNMESFWEDENATYIMFCMRLAPVLWISLPSLFVAYSLSQVFSPMKDKHCKLAFLMLPASAFEKYLVRLFLVFPFMTISMVCALLLAELTHGLFVPLLDCPDMFTQFTLDDTFRHFMLRTQIGDETYPWVVRFTIGMYCVWLFSLFLLGGAIWYRYAFIKMCGIGVALLVFFGIVEDFLPHPLILGTAWINFTLFAVLTIFNIWFPYYRFKWSQLK